MKRKIVYVLLLIMTFSAPAQVSPMPVSPVPEISTGLFVELLSPLFGKVGISGLFQLSDEHAILVNGRYNFKNQQNYYLFNDVGQDPVMIGWSASAQYRYYPKKQKSYYKYLKRPPVSHYIGFSTRYGKFSLYSDRASADIRLHEYFEYNSVLVVNQSINGIIGISRVFSNSICLDLYTGLGFARHTQIIDMQGTTFNQTTFDAEYTSSRETEDWQYWLPNFELGFQIGYIFK
jgi:hypothetical protein